MDHIARGVASAALTLQSIRLQALLGKDVLTPAEVRPRTAVHCRCRGEEGHQGVIAELQQEMLMAVENVPDEGTRPSCNGSSSAAPSCSTSTAPRIGCAASPTTTR